MIGIIANPVAKGKKAAKAAKKTASVLDQAGVDYEMVFTQRKGHATELAASLSQRCDVVVALGGDGTIHEVLNGLDCSKVKFGIIPSGSGNDFAAAAKIPLETEKAIDLILNGVAKPTDYMVCDGVKGLNVMGAGIDVDILKRCRKNKLLRGKLQYVFSLIISLIKFKFYNFTRIDGDNRTKKEALIACVGNGDRFGGGIRMCPEAILDDGKLDFVVAGKLKKIRIPFAFVKLMKGKILEQDFASFENIEEVKLEFDPSATVQIDGELYDGLKFEPKIVKSGVRIFRP